MSSCPENPLFTAVQLRDMMLLIIHCALFNISLVLVLIFLEHVPKPLSSLERSVTEEGHVKLSLLFTLG